MSHRLGRYPLDPDLARSARLRLPEHRYVGQRLVHNPAWIPQTLWPDALPAELAAGCAQLHRACLAMAMAKIGATDSWTDIANDLGLPIGLANSISQSASVSRSASSLRRPSQLRLRHARKTPETRTPSYRSARWVWVRRSAILRVQPKESMETKVVQTEPRPAVPSRPNAIETRSLTKRFGGIDALHLDLSAPMNSIFGFLGPNGAGNYHHDQVAARAGRSQQWRGPGVRDGHRPGQRRRPSADRLSGAGASARRPTVHRYYSFKDRSDRAWPGWAVPGSS